MGRPVPRFWWDFDRDGIIIVQSDWPGGERLAECATTDEADRLIADYKAGRATPRWAERAQGVGDEG